MYQLFSRSLVGEPPKKPVKTGTDRWGTSRSSWRSPGSKHRGPGPARRDLGGSVGFGVAPFGEEAVGFDGESRAPHFGVGCFGAGSGF